MKRNLYYKTVYKRTNGFKEFFLGLFMAISSYPRLLLEVFIRRNFGERYFSFSGAIVITVLLALLPVGTGFGVSALYRYYGLDYDGWTFARHYATWYAFLIAFMYMAVQRREEIKRLPSVFDFERFSLSTGVIHPMFRKMIINGRPASIRTIETLLEPLFFFTIGAFLWLFGQGLGSLLMICSIIYGLSYSAAYYTGDNFVMDKIDEMILNQEMVGSFVDGKDADETRGFRFYGRRPADPDMRRELVDSFFSYEETVEAI